jgi:hypothetical protein
MISLQIVDLFLKHQHPQILAQKFYDVQRAVKTRTVSREPRL